VCVAQLLVKLVRATVLGDAGEWIRAEVLIDIEKRHGLHKRTQDDLLMVGEVKLKKGKFCLKNLGNFVKNTPYLNCPVRQVHDNGTLRAEPRVEMGNTRQLIALLYSRIRPSLHQMLRHVSLEVAEQFHLLLELRRVLLA
jgi:hypothetical protein